MYMQERQQQIKQLLDKNGKVAVEELAVKFNVSTATIRHDLAMMQQAGLLSRTFGGAVATSGFSPNFSYEEKRQHNRRAKEMIAAAAKSLIKEGMSIFIDAGTTSFELASYLLNFKQLRVFTVDLNLAIRLAGYTNIDLFLLGGRVSHKTASTDSALTVNEIAKLRFDLAFIGCDAFDTSNVYITSENKAAVKSAALASATECILLADSSKYLGKAVRIFAHVDDFSKLVCEKKLATDLPAAFEKRLIIGGK